MDGCTVELPDGAAQPVRFSRGIYARRGWQAPYVIEIFTGERVTGCAVNYGGGFPSSSKMGRDEATENTDS